MKLVAAIFGILCGAILLLGISTGSVTPTQIAGIGIISACIAAIT